MYWLFWYVRESTKQVAMANANGPLFWCHTNSTLPQSCKSACQVTYIEVRAHTCVRFVGRPLFQWLLNIELWLLGWCCSFCHEYKCVRQSFSHNTYSNTIRDANIYSMTYYTHIAQNIEQLLTSILSRGLCHSSWFPWFVTTKIFINWIKDWFWRLHDSNFKLQNSHIPEFCTFVSINLNEACLTFNEGGLKVAFGILETWMDSLCVCWKPMHYFTACYMVAKHGIATMYNVDVLTHFWHMKSIPVSHGGTFSVLVTLISNDWLHSVWSINFAISK